ncbi:hypothetical protein PCC6311_0788 [Synechococcus elongatus PCC 6311]|uniref:Uncharacterized protein n=1 Tax=Synechococcus elongatus (strain ATCC 33912 / PCC 7942 / FACHB-805) TaxID=1140 RepID=Q31Q83_SYNE7|nr:hypothetical protein Synpcc7942_0754 [Synechococcus elongatus PCC 7942 = FACHB-805]AJD58921.1 hypothetical protein M744_12965 [Synechococcus elongatus UTEX 2973]UOW70549.1 hypothetical protein PCC7943_0788 [Synechococcus elongatus PCC 7943]UOW73270.1 hypothetical protein PCC6311_0788 [Synechococcus elongatus PCC 6311]UOW75991.1 hypothetical protein PCC6301pg_0788 [Synechococcus elongatus PCC 6301]
MGSLQLQVPNAPFQLHKLRTGVLGDFKDPRLAGLDFDDAGLHRPQQTNDRQKRTSQDGWCRASEYTVKRGMLFAFTHLFRFQ